MNSRNSRTFIVESTPTISLTARYDHTVFSLNLTFAFVRVAGLAVRTTLVYISVKLEVDHMKRFGVAFCWCLLIRPVVAKGQSLTPKPRLRFEVASVKLGDNTTGIKGGCHGIDSKLDPNDFAAGDVIPPLGRCLITNARLSHLIFKAYRLPLTRYAKGGPNWMSFGDVRFSIEAKCEDPATTTEAQLLEMLQDVLVDRFALRYHREEGTERGFILRVTNSGERLAPSAATKTDTHFSFPPAVNGQGKRIPGRPISIRATACSMGKLAEFLSVYGLGQVEDRTGLTGRYDFNLNWDDLNGPSLSSGLRELGLRLESRTVSVSFFVVESAHMPTPN